MKKIITKIGILSGVTLPIIAFAQQKDLLYLIRLVVQYFNYVIYLVLGLATLMFVWNIYKYFIKGGDDIKGKKDAGMYVLWSVIGFFVILSLWGIVNILTNTFRLDSNAPPGFFGNYGSSSSYSSPFNNLGNPDGGVTNNGNPGGVRNDGTSGGVSNNSANKPGFLRSMWHIIY